MKPTEQDKELEKALLGFKGNYGGHSLSSIMQLITQYGDTREREGRIDELSRMNSINLRAAAVVPRVSSDNRNPVKRMSDHILDRLAELKEEV